MSLFSKTEIKPEMESFIAKGEGVGIVKVNDYGKASARLESHKIILESYDNEYPIIESISSISYLSYDPGNFFQEPKLEIGLGQKKYILAGVDNNDDELEAFYKSVLNLKNQEKKQLIDSKTEPPKIQNKTNNNYDELDEFEEEVESKQGIKDTTNKIKGFLSKRFVISEEKEEPATPINNPNNINEFIDKKTEKTNDLESVLDDEEFIDEDDDEEILLIDEEIEEKQPETIKTQKKQEIEEINDYDEFDEFDEIDDFEELDDFEDDELILEEDIEEEVIEEKPSEDTVNNNEKQQKTQQPSENKEITQPTSKNIKDTIEQPEEPQATPQKINNTKTELDQEITQLKDDVNNNINNVNQQTKQNVENTVTSEEFDPVYQIRRYYELKKDGIITEEEFEQKKKQLLNL